MTPTRSSSTTCSPASATAPSSTSSTRGAASTAQFADVWLGLARRHRHRPVEHDRPRDHPRRSRQHGRSSNAARPASPSTRRRSRSGRSSAARRSPASRPRRSASSPTPTPAPTGAQLCWTLGITEHHNGVDNVLALINLPLLCGHVGRWGAGLNPLRGQNNVQGGGDMGALPNKLPGFQDVERRRRPRQVRGRVGRDDPARERLAPHRDVRGDGARRPAGAVRDRREPGPVGGRRRPRRSQLLDGLDHLVVQDIFLTKTAAARRRRAARVGVVVRDQRHGHQLRASRAAGAQGARPARRGPRRHRDPARPRRATSVTTGTTDDGTRTVWDELRSPVADARRHVVRRASPSSAASSGRATHEDRLEPSFLHGRLWADDPADRGRLAPFSVVVDDPPVDELDDEFPLRLDDRPPARLLQHRRAVGRLPQPQPARRDDRRVARRTPSGSASPTARSVRVSSRRGHGRGPGAHRPRAAARVWCS